VATERVREAPPLPFDLGTLQQVCSRQLALDVQETLDLAQALYETHKATTYPRSDSGYLPESMFAEVPAVLAALLASDPSLRPLLELLDRTQRSRAWNDSRVSAHHGIIPTLEPANLAAMSDKELAVYQLIRAHYLAQFLPHHEFDRTTAQLRCGEQHLQAVGKQVIIPGWHQVLAVPEADNADGETAPRSQVLPALHEGLSCQVEHVDLKALKTQPPKPYTQGDLIQAMKGVAKLVTDPRLKQKLKETTGIGTEATRASIIKGLLERGYLLKKGRAVRASDAACTLIDAVPAAIHRSRYDRGLGAGPGHDRSWRDDAGNLRRQAIHVDHPTGAAVPLGHPGHQTPRRPRLPAVRQRHTPTHRQERPVLVLLPLSRLHRHPVRPVWPAGQRQAQHLTKTAADPEIARRFVSHRIDHGRCAHLAPAGNPARLSFCNACPSPASRWVDGKADSSSVRNARTI